MTFILKPALDYKFADLAEFLNESFSGYIVDIKVTPSLLAQLVRYEGTDLTASRIILKDDKLVGCALIGRRGWMCRVAAMGIVPAWRGQGAGQWTMEQVVDEAKSRQEQTMGARGDRTKPSSGSVV